MQRVYFCALFALIGLCGEAIGQFGAGKALPGGGPSPDGTNARNENPYHAMIRLVVQTIEPDSWDEYGGPGTAEPLEGVGVIVVSHTDEVHEKIENLFRLLRKAKQLQEAPAKPDERNRDIPVSIVVESEKWGEFRRRAEQALGAEANVDFDEVPLGEVIKFLNKAHGISLFIDTRALEDLGLGTDTPVTIKRDKTTLRSVLRLMLREYGLTYTTQDEVIKITSADKVESMLETRLYLVKDLIKLPENPKRKPQPAAGTNANLNGTPGSE